MSRQKRTFAEKTRNKQNRKEKPMIIITAEGRNETESRYFRCFNTADCPYIIKIHKAGNVTDPTKLAASIRKQWKEEGAHKQIGDRAVVIVDLDNSESKAKEIRRLKNRNDIEEYIVSNPSFEVWYLLHFEYSTRSYMDAGAAIKELLLLTLLIKQMRNNSAKVFYM